MVLGIGGDDVLQTNTRLGGGFKYFLCSSLFGEDFQFDEHIFQMGWFNHQPVRIGDKNTFCKRWHLWA